MKAEDDRPRGIVGVDVDITTKFVVFTDSFDRLYVLQKRPAEMIRLVHVRTGLCGRFPPFTRHHSPKFHIQVM